MPTTHPNDMTVAQLADRILTCGWLSDDPIYDAPFVATVRALAGKVRRGDVIAEPLARAVVRANAIIRHGALTPGEASAIATLRDFAETHDRVATAPLRERSGEEHSVYVHVNPAVAVGRTQEVNDLVRIDRGLDAHGREVVVGVEVLVAASVEIDGDATSPTPEGGDLAAVTHAVWVHLAAVFSAGPDGRGDRTFYSTDTGSNLTSGELAERIARDVCAPAPSVAAPPQEGEGECVACGRVVDLVMETHEARVGGHRCAGGLGWRAPTAPPAEGEAANELRAAYEGPSTGFNLYDEDGGEPREPFVRWALAFGCAVTIGRDEDGELSVHVAMSDASGNGHEARRLTAEQVDAYGRHLIALAALRDASPAPEVVTHVEAQNLPEGSRIVHLQPNDVPTLGAPVRYPAELRGMPGGRYRVLHRADLPGVNSSAAGDGVAT